MARLTKQQQAERADAIAELRRLLPPGSTACTILRHVSRSGMARDISVVVGEPSDLDGVRNVTYLVAAALGENVRNAGGHNAIRVGGAGMDMGFHLIYGLSRTLWQTDLDSINPTHTNGGTDAGYAIRQRWL